ncbi:DUF4129 domain-containing protein [Halegenticoccus soli]|uniref:DUF4129 domain-containing protein n=1 Tax=Halegenticoccus soli TaxID=1985678 RepID=UPI000C6ED494|nr:DUF4129 domain-containing protein [Halegenticoccus soli]
MDRNAALTAGLALLAVVALALAAATLDSAVVSTGGGGGGFGPGDPPGFGSGDRPPGGEPAPAREGGLFQPPCVPALADPRLVAGVVAAFLVATAAVYWRTRTLLVPAAFAVAFGIPVALVYALLTACVRSPAGPGSPLPSGNGTGILPNAGGGGLGPAGQAVSTPSVALGILLVVALLGSVLLLFVSTGDEDAGSTAASEPEPESDVDAAAIGRAAGEAADRIEGDADVENEVYRAWAEMTASIDVAHPRSSTPGEFASAAVEAGMDREDVDELTALFESVRYGGAEPTEARERRAVRALRRIEAAYADGRDDA